MHLGEHVQAVVAGSPVRADRHVAAGGEHLGDLRHAARELEIGRRAVHHVGPLARQAGDLVRVDPHAVGQGGPRPRDPDRVEIGDLLEACGAQHRLALDDRLGGVGVQLGPEPLRQVARRPQQRPGAGRHEAGGEAHPQAALRCAVPAARQRLGVSERGVGGLREVERRPFGMRVHEALPRGRADSHPLQRREGRAGVAHRLHIEDRRRTAQQ